MWDFPTRAFHWLLTLSLLGSWITAEAGFEWTETHFLFGYCSLGLIAFRIIWGFVGTRYSRFRNFIKGPAAVWDTGRKLFTRNPPDEVGHNPLGGWSVMIMLLLVGVQATTGLFISDDIFYAGPYNAVVSSSTAGSLAAIHHTNFVLLQIAVATHLAAIIWYRLRKKAVLVTPMVTGKKMVPNNAAIASSKPVRALIITALVIMFVTLLVQLAPPPAMDNFSF